MARIIKSCPQCGAWSGPSDGDGSRFESELCDDCREDMEAQERAFAEAESIRRVAEDAAYRRMMDRRRTHGNPA